MASSTEAAFRPARSIDVLGYLAPLLPLLILAGGWLAGHHYALAFFFFFILPFSRLLFGAALDVSPEFTELQARFLDAIPLLYAAIAIPCALLVPFALAASDPLSPAAFFGLLLSTLVACGLGSCVSHALIHRGRWAMSIGSVLSSVMANPWLRYEHLFHHARARNTEHASAPRLAENLYSFIFRRHWLTPAACFRWRHSAVGAASIKHPLDDLYTHIAITACVWVAFALVAGTLGFVFYGLLVLLVPSLISAINYIQHWGLGDDQTALPANLLQIGWDDDCQVLTWLSLGLNFHDDHHQAPSRSYFVYDTEPFAPRLPFSYGFALFAAMVPPVWNRVMSARLSQWLANPAAVGRAGSRLFCFSPRLGG